MTTGMWVLERAVELMDEDSVRDFEERALGLLNVLRHRVWRCSEKAGVGETCPEVKSLEQVLELEDSICQGVLPYGLAALLLVGDRDAEAAFLWQRFEGLLQERQFGTWEEI